MLTENFAGCIFPAGVVDIHPRFVTMEGGSGHALDHKIFAATVVFLAVHTVYIRTPINVFPVVHSVISSE
jgi:hypothetical protein